MTTELNSYPTPNTNVYNKTTRNKSAPYGCPNLTLVKDQFPPQVINQIKLTLIKQSLTIKLHIQNKAHPILIETTLSQNFNPQQLPYPWVLHKQLTTS